MKQIEQMLEKYADLAVRVGVNIQQRQTLVVNAPLPAAEFVRKIVAKAYEAGAKNVHVEFQDENITRIKYEKAPDEAFTEYPMWRAKGMEEMAENGAAFLSIYSPNPELLKGIDPQRIATWNKTAGTALKKYRSYMMADKARRLGEVALVPHRSPISNSGLTFYNTLFDENASNHLALGEAYPVNLQHGTEMTPEELSECGANKSLVHEDFMIGSADMNIYGITKDGKREWIFKSGNWAF